MKVHSLRMFAAAICAVFLGNIATAQQVDLPNVSPVPANLTVDTVSGGQPRLSWAPVPGHGPQTGLHTASTFDYSPYVADNGVDQVDWDFGDPKEVRDQVGQNTNYFSSYGFDVMFFNNSQGLDNDADIFTYQSIDHSPFQWWPEGRGGGPLKAKFDQLHYFNADPTSGTMDMVDVSPLGITHPDQLFWYPGDSIYIYSYLIINDNNESPDDVASALTIRHDRMYGVFTLTQNVIYADGQSSYNVYRREAGTATFTRIAEGITDNFFVDNVLPNSPITYEYVVTGMALFGESQASNAVTIEVGGTGDEGPGPIDPTPIGPTIDSVIYRVNAGGNTIPAVDGGVSWEEDKRWVPSTYLASDFNGHRVFTVAKTAYDTTVDQGNLNLELFTTDRWDRSGGDDITYAFPVDPGLYEVRLYLAEQSATATAGSRVFSVSIEGVVPDQLENIDLAATYGPLVGVVKTHALTVTDGTLDVVFLRGLTGNPLVNGIEIFLQTIDSTAGPTPTPTPNLVLSQENLFYNTEVGTGPDTAIVTLTNSGDAPLTGVNLAISGADETLFSLDANGFSSIPAGQSVDVAVRFEPATGGNKVATLTVSSTDPLVSDKQVSLFGQAFVTEVPTPELTVDSTSFTFNAEVGTSGDSAILVITNPGTADLVDLNLSISGPQAEMFALSQNTVSNIPSNGAYMVGVYFIPTTGGDMAATLTLTPSETSVTPLQIALSGTGTLPAPPEDTTTTPGTDSAVVVYRVNAGGNSLTPLEGGVEWEEDRRWVPSAFLTSDFNGHRTFEVSKTGYDPSVDQGNINLDMFTSERWDRNGGEDITYAFPVDSGQYEVRVYMAESNATASSGSRIFSISIEGAIPSNMADIDLAGTYGALIGVVQSHTLSVSDGTLDVIMQRGPSGNPQLNGLEILKVTHANTPEPEPEPEPGPTPMASLSLSSNSLSFQSEIGAGPSAMTLTLTNDGDATLEGVSLAINGLDAALFGTSTNSIPSIGASQSVDVQINFSPTTEGTKTATLIVSSTDANVEDQQVSLSGLATSPPPTSSGTAIYRVNAGGNTLAALDGGVSWETDKRWVPSAYLTSDYNGHRTYSIPKTGYDVSVDQGSINLEMFTTERWDRNRGEDITYAFPVESGQYEVRVYMAEYDVTAGPGSRVFSISLEGAVPSSMADIDLAGSYGPSIGVLKSHTLTVTDGTLDVVMQRGPSGNPQLNGLEIIQLTGSPTRLTQDELSTSSTQPTLEITPNPVFQGDRLSVEILYPAGFEQDLTYRPKISLFTLNGIQVWAQDMQPGQTSALVVPKQALSAGVYILKVEGKSWTQSKRVIWQP